MLSTYIGRPRGRYRGNRYVLYRGAPQDWLENIASCFLFHNFFIYFFTLTDFAPQRLADEYRVDREHQPVAIVTAGVAGQVTGVRERFVLLLPGREQATRLVFAGHHVRGYDIIVVYSLGQGVFRVPQQL